MHRQLAVLMLIATLLISACNKSPNSDPAISNAVRALKRVEAATQVGTSLVEYRKLLIDAKVQVDEASAKLPEGELKRELNAAFTAYNDASEIWFNYKAKNKDLFTYYEKDKALIIKYSLSDNIVATYIPVDKDEAMQKVWLSASKHLERSSALTQQ